MPTVGDVMSTEVTTVSHSEVVGPVRDLVMDKHIGMVPVLDDAGELAGVVTASDLVEEWAPQLGVTEVMTREVQTVTPGMALAEAASLMLERRIHHLVVTERSKMVGVISSFDMIRALAGEVRAATSASGPAVRAQVGDHIVIRGHAVGEHERRGIIAETRGADGGPPFMVQWLDDAHDHAHEVMFFPGSDADIEHTPTGS